MSDRTSRRDLSPHWPAGTLMSAVDGMERNELFSLGEPQRHEAGAILIAKLPLGALAMGVSWAMLSSWGLSIADYVLYTLVTGIWNVDLRFGNRASAPTRLERSRVATGSGCST